MFELIIASGLVLMVLTGAGMVVSNTERIGIATRAKDTATALGISVIERATAFGCGMQTTPGPSNTSVNARCKSVYDTDVPADGASLQAALEPVPGSNGAGGFSSDVFGVLMWDPTLRPFTVDYTTRWLAPSFTSTSTTPPCPDETAGKPPKPALLERTVNLRWLVLGKENEVTLSSMTATPSGYLASGSLAGDIVVEAPEGSLVVLTAGTQDPATAISRVATRCGASGRSVAWFPFLRLTPPDPETNFSPATLFTVGLNAPGTQEVQLTPDLPYAKVVLS